MTKRGWRDVVSEELAGEAREMGLGDRPHLRTFFDLQDADEGRPPRFAE
jgi:hypothetical protein